MSRCLHSRALHRDLPFVQVEDDPTGGKFASASGMLNGAANKLEDVINFHVGDSITALQRSALQPGGQEVLVYSTLLGTLGSLLPFVSREDWDFFSHLEMHMRQELPPLSGREHVAYRGYYFPIKDVIDGDLCEQYSLVRPTTLCDTNFTRCST